LLTDKIDKGNESEIKRQKDKEQKDIKLRATLVFIILFPIKSSIIK